MKSFPSSSSLELSLINRKRRASVESSIVKMSTDRRLETGESWKGKVQEIMKAFQSSNDIV